MSSGGDMNGEYSPDSTGELKGVLQGKQEWKGRVEDLQDQSQWQQATEKWRTRISERLQKGFKKRTPNILIVGLSGVGKSSFVNTIAAGLSGEWHEYAYTGHYGAKDEPVTVYLKVYPRCGLPEGEGELDETPLPDLIDLAGFQNEYNPVLEEVLRAICYGRIPRDENIMKVLKMGQDDGISRIREEYPDRNEDLVVDRVIVLAAADETVPEKLLKCIKNAARPPATGDDVFRRAIPVFSVMTKYDKLKSSEEKEEYKQREEKLIEILGMKGATQRFAKVSNYCDDTAPDKTEENHPELDKEILRFLFNVLDPAYKTDHDTDNPDVTLLRQEGGADEVINQRTSDRTPTPRRPAAKEPVLDMAQVIREYTGLDVYSRQVQVAIFILLVALWVLLWNVGAWACAGALFIMIASFMILSHQRQGIAPLRQQNRPGRRQ